MISFVVLCHNEGEFLKKCIPNIEKFLLENDEIIIVDDDSTDQNTIGYLSSTKHKVVYHKLNNDFSSHRNYAHQFCNNPYVFMVDSDELISDVLGHNLHDIINSNPDVELFSIPRLNIVDGMSQTDVIKWGWRLSRVDGCVEYVVNFPDKQNRLYKKLDNIQWKGKLHEKVYGAKIISELPESVGFCLIHRKTIDRQTKQNMFYNQNFTQNENRGIHNE